MLHPNTLKTVKETTSIYPGKNNACVVECIYEDNSLRDVNVLKDEVDLTLYLKTSIFKKLNQQEQVKLLELIENFGDQKYEEGSFDASYEG